MVPPPPLPPMVAPLPPGVFTISGTIQSSGDSLSELGVVLLSGGTQLSATDAYCYPANAPKFPAPGRSFTIPNVAPGSYLVLGYRMAANKERFERTMVRVEVTDKNVDQVSIPLLQPLMAHVNDGPGDQEVVKWAPPDPSTFSAFQGFAFRLNADFEEACHGGTEIQVRQPRNMFVYEASPRETDRVKVSIENKTTMQLAVRIQEIDAEEDDVDDDDRRPRR